MAQTELHHAPKMRDHQLLNITRMFNDDIFNDVTFVIGKERKEFHAHRALLAAISPVFRAMLYGNMRESEIHSIITISDIDPIGFECIVKYSYCMNPKKKFPKYYINNIHR